jgi:hypothetical protein
MGWSWTVGLQVLDEGFAPCEEIRWLVVGNCKEEAKEMRVVEVEVEAQQEVEVVGRLVMRHCKEEEAVVEGRWT